MSARRPRHELAGRSVRLNDQTAPGRNGLQPGAVYVVEDWWVNVAGISWMNADGNPAAMLYALRIGSCRTRDYPIDDEVVYGHVDGIGHLVHASELGEPVRAAGADR